MRAPAWLIAATLVFGQTNAFAQEVGDPEAGLDYAHQVCAVCHAVEGRYAFSPHPDAPTFHKIANVPGMTATALFVVLRTPHSQMPDLIIPPADMRNVIAYILSLKAGD